MRPGHCTQATRRRLGETLAPPPDRALTEPARRHCATCGSGPFADTEALAVHYRSGHIGKGPRA